MNWRNILERAAWTALQAGLSAVAVLPGLTDVSGWKVAGGAFLSAAIASFLSAVKTAVKEAIAKRADHAGGCLLCESLGVSCRPPGN